MTNIDNIKRKITALLAKANGTDNENEAALFLEKAQAMLEEYQISEWELGDTDDLMGITKISNAYARYYKLWNALAQYYGCKVIIHKGGKVKVDVVGRESSRVTTELMFYYIIKEIAAMGRRVKAQGNHPESAAALSYHIHNALIIRITKLVREQRNTQSAKAQSYALVVVNELQAFIDDFYGNLRKGKVTKIKVTDVARREAEKISLYRQMGGKTQLKIG